MTAASEGFSDVCPISIWSTHTVICIQIAPLHRPPSSLSSFRCTNQFSVNEIPPVIPPVSWSPCIATSSIVTRPRPSPTAARKLSSSTSRSTQSSKTAYGPRRVQVDATLPCVARGIPGLVPAIFQSCSIASVSIPSPKPCRGKGAGNLQAYVCWLPISLILPLVCCMLKSPNPQLQHPPP